MVHATDLAVCLQQNQLQGRVSQRLESIPSNGDVLYVLTENFSTMKRLEACRGQRIGRRTVLIVLIEMISKAFEDTKRRTTTLTETKKVVAFTLLLDRHD